MPFVKRLSQEEKTRISELRRLQAELKYRFRDISLLDQALTHSSFSHEQNLPGKDYERMEFLGDSILGMVISEYLFRQFPFFTEGQLTKLKSQIVSTSTLATLGKTLQIENFLRMGKGESKPLGSANSSTSSFDKLRTLSERSESNGLTTSPLFLAGALEAIVAAVYLDGGLRPASQFILSHFHPEIQRIEEGKGKRDYKSMLQELTLKRFKSTPHYDVISEIGSQHQKQFDIRVTIEGKLYGCGSGRNKKSAQQQAAKEALTKFMAL